MNQLNLIPNFDNPKNKEISLAKKEIFLGKGYHIFKSVISKEDALIIQDFFLKRNPKTFSKLTFKKLEEGNHRLYYYPTSPYWHPPFVDYLWRKIVIVRNTLYEGETWFEQYKLRNNLDKKSSEQIIKFQRMHNWACFYWYKKNETHFKHIDEEGELGCFLILTEKDVDYLNGGLYIYKDDSDEEGYLIDNELQIGDLVIFDQSRFHHEVKNLVIKDQLGRFQFYVPNIPDGRLKEHYTFGESNKVYFSRPTNFLIKKLIEVSYLFKKRDIHYSRKPVFYEDSSPPIFKDKI